MGAYKRLAVLVLVTIGACLFVGHPSRAEPQEVVAAVARDFYPEYMIDTDGHPGGSGIDLMNAVAKRAGLSVTTACLKPGPISSRRSSAVTPMSFPWSLSPERAKAACCSPARS